MPADKDKVQQDHYQKVLLELLKLPENRVCADCHAKGPRWASASIGVFVCIKCSGIHRSLGTHISFVRSVTLDKWNEDQVKRMTEVGNAKAREIFEANLPDNFMRPNESDSYALEQFIRNKYEHKQFCIKDDSKHKTRKTKQREESVVHETPQKQQHQQQQNHQTNKGSDLISLESTIPQTPNVDFSGFQSATPEFSGFQSAAPKSDAFANQFITPTPSVLQPAQTPKGFDSESAFFGDFQSTQQPVKPSKESILNLYNTPATPTTSSNFPSMNQPNMMSQPMNQSNMMNQPMMNQPNMMNMNQQQQKTTPAPNYNVVLPGLGMPATGARNPSMGVPSMGGVPPMGGMNMNYNMNQPNQYGVQMGQQQYPNVNMNYGVRPQAPVSPVNTNGYVNANYLQKQQQQPGVKFM